MNFVGNLLIAPPSVKGTFWYKTVVMITEHHQDGSIGLVLNKRSSMTIEELGYKLGLELNIPGFIYQGGPISPKSLSILHSNEWKTKNTLKINEKFSLSSSDDMLPRFELGDMPRYWRVFSGMCGWAEHQLLSEVKGTPPYSHNTSWCTASSNLDLVFDTDNKEQWIAALDQAGLEFAQNILT